MIGWIFVSVWACGAVYATAKGVTEALIEAHRDARPTTRDLVAEATAALIAGVLILSMLWWHYLGGDLVMGRPGLWRLARDLKALRRTAREDTPEVTSNA